VRIGAVSMAAKRQLKRSKSFELFIIGRFFHMIRHPTKRKVSFYFYGGKRIKRNRRPWGLRCDTAGHRLKSLTVRSD